MKLISPQSLVWWHQKFELSLAVIITRRLSLTKATCLCLAILKEENLVNAGFEVGGAFEACVAQAFGVRI